MRLEAKLLAPDRVFPFLDVPLFMHKDPRLFEVETNELIVRIAKCRDVFKSDRFLHVVTLAPGIFVGGFEDVKEALVTFKRNNNLRSEHEVYEEKLHIVHGVANEDEQSEVDDPEILYVESLKTHVINDEGNMGCSI